MPNVTNELVYELLKQINERLTRMEQGQELQSTRLNNMDTKLAALQGDVANLYAGQQIMREDVIKTFRRMDVIEAE